MSTRQADPTPRRLRIAVIGAGMAGILAAIRLRETGHHRVVIYEKAGRIGGTWRENTYPGLACDVPAHAYTYSFAPNAEWSSYLAPGSEIQRYFESVAQAHRLDEIIRYGEEVTRCELVDGRWHIETARGTQDDVDVVIAATGVLHHPGTPDIAGLDRFAGPCFHSARWDHSVPLDGRRIGIVGCGSTGVQIVSALAGRASRLVHIQRTPQWIMPVPNDPYTEEQKAAFRADPALIDAIRYGEEYTSAVRRFTDAIVDQDSLQIREIEAIVLRNLEDSVTDPVLREKLRPDYRAACKRLIYSPDYYQKVQRPDVEVAIGPIRQIEPAGVRMADGSLHEVDILVLATGFRADRFVRPMRVRGRNGADIDAAWSPAPSAYLGISVPGFPNFFMLNGPTGPVGNFSLIDIAERQWGYIGQLIAGIESGKCRMMDLKEATMRDYDARRIAAAKRTIFGSGCKSWYLDATGVPSSWPWSYDSFAEQTAAPKIAEYEYIP
ncbi:MAG: flavin-containing monooxygenase [Steroidobacteraceae bacterium]